MTGRADGSIDSIEVDVPWNTTGEDAVRNSISRLHGAHHMRPLEAQLSWLIRSAEIPFDSLHDLAGAYSLRQVGPAATIEVVALLAAHIDSRSAVSGVRTDLLVKVLKSFRPDQFRAGYRVLSANDPPRRGVFHHNIFYGRTKVKITSASSHLTFHKARLCRPSLLTLIRRSSNGGFRTRNLALTRFESPTKHMTRSYISSEGGLLTRIGRSDRLRARHVHPCLASWLLPRSS